MKLLVVAATLFEVLPLKSYLEQHFTCIAPNIFAKEELQIHLLITGIGQMLTGYAMGYVIAKENYDFAINAGVAGAYNRELQIGQVVNVNTEQFGDLGAEDADGSFLSIHNLGLLPMDEAPFSAGKILNKEANAFDFLTKVHGVTVNKVHGYEPTIARDYARYQADVESMEGAAFAYICRVHEIPFLQIRAISNYVESRNREAWNLPLAITNLNKVLQQIITILSTSIDKRD